VKFFFGRLMEKEIDIRELKGLKICAIGTKTAACIRKLGLKVDLLPEEFRAEGLIAAFVKEGGRQIASQSGGNDAKPLEGMRFLLPRAEVAREIFPEKVKELGGKIDVPVAYRAVKPDHHGKRLRRFLKEGRITVATFTSAATFNNFREMMGSESDGLLRDVAIAVIGPVTAKAVEKAGLKVEIMPAEATVEAMVEEIKKWVSRNAPASGASSFRT